MRGKGHAGGHGDTVRVTLAALRRHDFNLSVFVRKVKLFLLITCHSIFCLSAEVVLEIWRDLKGCVLRCGFEAGWHFTTTCL